MDRLVHPCLVVSAFLLSACGSTIMADQPAPTAPVESITEPSHSALPAMASSAPSFPATTVPSPAIAAVESQEADWTEVSPPGKGFSVLMPSKPAFDKQYMELPFGRMPVSIYSLELDTVTYMVGIITYPKEITRSSDPVGMLTGALGGAIKNVNGRLVHEQEITLNGNPGREVMAEGAGDGSNNAHLPVGSLMQARLYVVDNQLYQVIAFGAKASLHKADTDQVFSSFQLNQK